MLAISEKRRRRTRTTYALLAVLAVIIFTPKLDQIELPNFGVPFVTVAVADEVD